MIITKVPVAIGEGIPLFINNDHESKFKLENTIKVENGTAQFHYKKV